MEPVPTVAAYLGKLTYREQLILCNCIRESLDELKYAHLTPALLPFVTLKDAHRALGTKRTTRPVAILIAKLHMEQPWNNVIWLNDTKVIRVFGTKPNHGIRLHWLPSCYVNGKKVDPLVRLAFVRKGLRSGQAAYRVTCHKGYMTAVMAWLCDNLT